MPDPLVDIESLTALQTQKVAEWHTQPDPLPESAAKGEGFAGLVLRNHYHNYRIWHHEDQARRTDVDDTAIADVKRNIDRQNQLRNDAMEKIDDALLEMLKDPDPDAPMNSESPGSIFDRLSILSLKSHHMREETERADADAEHLGRCRQKLSILDRQRADLAACLSELLAACATGQKRLVVYRQFKMYNDPSLNPAVYGKK